MSNWRTRPEPIPASEITCVHETDVLVVGLAHAGSAALRAAAESGVRVMGIEEKKQSTYSVWGADYGHINSKFLASRGVPRVDPIDYYNELMRRALGRANPGLVMKFCQNMGSAFDWYTDMVEQFGGVSIAFWPGGSKFDGEMAGFHFWPGTVKFPAMPGGGMPHKTVGEQAADDKRGEFPGGIPMAGDDFPGAGGAPGPGGPGEGPGGPGEGEGPPPGMFPGMDSPEAKLPPLEQVKVRPSLTSLALANQEKAKQLGGQVFFGMEAVDILTEAGRVTGLIARDKATGDYHKFLTTRAVLLAAGGFGGNPEMLEELLPDFRGLFAPGEGFSRGMGRSGIALKLGVWAGGRLETGPIATMGGNFNTPRGFNCVHGLLWLDPNGKRFCNECFGDPVITGMQGNQHPHGMYYNLFDSRVLEDLQWAVPAHEGFDNTDESYVSGLKRAMDLAVKAGPGGAVSRAPNGPVRIVAGGTVEELLDNAGLEGQLRENIAASLARYNQLCRAGRDDDFGKDAKLLRPLEAFPLFLQFNELNYLGRIMCTCGGLLTDENQNVLAQDFTPLPGLYATGNCCGRRWGPQYSTPTSGLSIGMCVTLGREAGKAAAR